MSFSYVSNYDAAILHGIDETPTRPWDLNDEILRYANRHSSLLDIGCGTAAKLIPLSSYFGQIIGVDISESMLNAAQSTIEKNKLSNIRLIQCDSNKLPFEDNSYDVITCMVSRWNIKEIHRALKPSGVVIVEHIGCEDKKDFKILFGKDHEGSRGQFIDFKKEDYLKYYHDMFYNLFDTVSIQNGYWKTYYTEQGILELLKFTPTIRNFDIEKDIEALRKGYTLFQSTQGIVLTQNRILIHAKIPKNF